MKMLEHSDHKFYLALFTDKELMSLVGQFEDKVLLTKSFKNTIEFNRQTPFSRLTYCIYYGDERVGITSLIRSAQDNAKCEIGTIIKPDFLYKGVACEVMQCLIKLSFQQLEISQVYADFSAKNHAAHKLVIKLGFTVIAGKDNFYHCYIDKNDIKNTKIEVTNV